MRQVGYLQELYREARSTNVKKTPTRNLEYQVLLKASRDVKPEAGKLVCYVIVYLSTDIIELKPQVFGKFTQIKSIW